MSSHFMKEFDDIIDRTFFFFKDLFHNYRIISRENTPISLSIPSGNIGFTCSMVNLSTTWVSLLRWLPHSHLSPLITKAIPDK